MEKPKDWKKNNKSKFAVYTQHYLLSEFPDESFQDDWKLAGETYAVSETQAINNVRYRQFGDKGSQYKPMATDCHWENGLHWKAIKQD